MTVATNRPIQHQPLRFDAVNRNRDARPMTGGNQGPFQSPGRHH
jgi:hypothetical protein